MSTPLALPAHLVRGPRRPHGVLGRPRGTSASTVLTATGVALVLHLLWLFFLAGSGGDLAAQDAWTDFAIAHPSSAYDFAWYGGMHPASYSLFSPYLMGLIGVRTTLLLCGTVSAALVALLLVRVRSVRRPMVPAVYAALALTGNAVSGRATFGLGVTLALASLCVLLVRRPDAPRGRENLVRAVATVVLAGLATAASPVAGLFLGFLAATLWIGRRRSASLLLGVAPVVVVAGTAVLFPFKGVQPFPWSQTIFPISLAAAGWLLLPRGWRLGRVTSLVYAVAVVAVWVVPTPIGTNVTRLALLFAGVALVAAAVGPWQTSLAARRWGRRTGVVLLAAGILAATTWQALIVGRDLHGSAAAATLDPDVRPLVAQLDAHDADLGRVEVVPTQSHREASALAPYVNLARGWNRQADVARNQVFYRPHATLTSAEYLRWLHRWAVRLVVLPNSSLDHAALQEGEVVRSGVSYLHEVWSDPTWTLYEVEDPTPLTSSPGTVLSSTEDGVTISMPAAGTTLLRLVWSPWLALVGPDGERLATADRDGACISPVDTARSRVTWVRLTAPSAGTYRLGAPLALPRGSTCPTPGD